MLKSLKELATKAGLRTDDEGDGVSLPAPPPVQASSAAPAPHAGAQLSVVNPTAYVSTIGPADPQMVASIKDSVLKASPMLGMFFANCETMRKAFPHDEGARMRAALAMMGTVDKPALLSELQRTVTAALAQQKTSAAEQRDSQRQNAVGTLERELENLAREITASQEEMQRQQALITEKQTRVVTLQGDVRAADLQLKQQNSVVDASFAEVERQLQSLIATFTQL